MLKLVRVAVLSLSGAAALVPVFALLAAPALAQTMGFATLPPGTLNHTTASAISKVLKDKGGINMLVQPTAGDQVINPMVGRGEVEIGITNIMEAQDALDGQFKDMRLIAAVNTALADLQGRAVAAAGASDLGALTDQLKDIQFDAERQFARLTASLVEAQEQLTRRAGDR